MQYSLYIHIPFCKQKCNYCDFVSYAGKEDLIDAYVEAMVREIRQWKIDNQKWEIGTIYIGGGTPTLLEPKHFEKILSPLTRLLENNPPLPKGEGLGDIELSIEVNPGTIDFPKLKALRSLGINRLSLGAQSFNDEKLKMLGRIHTAQEIYAAYDNARKAGFENINLDLIFALPNQTLEEWKDDLSQAIHLMPNHLSTYNLQIEECTPLWKRMKNQSSPLSPWERGLGGEGLKRLSDEEELAMYEYTIEQLTANGFRHYEISNFAKPGFECQHNINYWKNGNYIGIGAGAHSHWNGRRWENPALVEEYIQLTNNLQLTTNNQFITSNVSQAVTDQRDTLIMGLRLLDGIEMDKFKGFEKEVDRLRKEGLLEQANNNYRLTRQGLYLANEVFRRFV